MASLEGSGGEANMIASRENTAYPHKATTKLLLALQSLPMNLQANTVTPNEGFPNL